MADPTLTSGNHILIVEDSLTQRMRLQRILDTHGFRVTIATNGREALASLETTLPDLIITDINMPEMDGYTLCQQIKDNPRRRDLPVILLTSLSDPQDILKGLECGADNFISKPYEEEFLLSRVHFVLRNLDLRRQSSDPNSAEIFFAGRVYKLTTERVHSIDLLLSTYETAVQKNLELSKASAKLEKQAEQLREKNEEMRADLDLARELQSAFLPRHYPVFPARCSPEQSAIQFCHRYATTAELGGDFFDVRPLSDSAVGVLVCDVMGHGVRAALVVSILRGLAEELKPLATEPGRFFTELNRSLRAILRQTPTQMFATGFYLYLDVAAGQMRYVNAGHPSPLHVRRSTGVVEPLLVSAGPHPPGSMSNPALAISETAVFIEATRSVAPQDMIMLYTDGLYEVEGPEETYYDHEGLVRDVTTRLSLPTPTLLDELLTEIRAFSVKKDFEDDMCVVGVDVTRLLR